ncbi:MAG: protein kinase [Acidimicrobiales bacterium]
MDLRIGGLGEATEIGSGASSVVYRAKRLSDGRDVAVKVLNMADPTFVARFEREVAMLTTLSRSPRIVTVHEAGTTERGRPYLVLDLCRSTLLERIERDGRIEPAEACDILAEITEAVADAHQIDIVHRDLKPGNVLVSEAGDHLVADFGIGTFMGATTTGGTGIGFTAGYVAPETLTGDSPGPPADIYALGATLFHMLSGRAPFVDPSGESNLFALANRIATDPVADLRPAGVPDEVCRVVEAAMAKDPDVRPTADELRHRLLAVAGGPRSDGSAGEHADENADDGRVRSEAASPPGDQRASSLPTPGSLVSPPSVPGYRAVTFLERERELSVFLAQPESAPPEGALVVALRVADRRQSDLDRRRQLRTRWKALAGAADHPRLAPIDGYGFTADGRPFIALVHHEGQRVGDRAAAAPLPWMEVAAIGVRLAAGLEVLARHHLVHGNVRPTAVLVDVDGEAVLGEYAVAGPEPDRAAGTVAEVWTAPELVGDGPPTVAGDLFGLGATLARLAGATVAGDPGHLARRLETDVALTAVPDPLRRLLLALVDPDPGRRPASARDVIGALRSLQSDHGLTPTPSLLEPPPPMPPAETASAAASGPAVPEHDEPPLPPPPGTVLGDDVLRQLGFDAPDAVGRPAPIPGAGAEVSADAARTADLSDILAAHHRQQPEPGRPPPAVTGTVTAAASPSAVGRPVGGPPPLPPQEPVARPYDTAPVTDRRSLSVHHHELPASALRRLIVGGVAAVALAGAVIYLWQQRDDRGDTTLADATTTPAPPTAVVPLVANVDEENAVARIQNAGFTAVITHRFDPASPQGSILSATPSSGSTAEVGSSVELVVSLGAEPSCTGSSREEIRRQLDLRGIAVALVAEEFNESVEAGAGLRCEFDTETPSAVVFVSKGPDPEAEG